MIITDGGGGLGVGADFFLIMTVTPDPLPVSVRRLREADGLTASQFWRSLVEPPASGL